MSDTTSQGAGVIEHIDPHTLTIETNVRTETRLTDEFTDSIPSSKPPSSSSSKTPRRPSTS